MRIACISASQVPSLTANSLQVMKACQALTQLGHDVHLLVPQHLAPANPEDIFSLYGIKTRFPVDRLSNHPRLHRYDLASRAISKARQLKADVTYVWLLQAGIASLLAGIPTLIELHGPPEGRFGPSLFRMFQRLSGKKRLLPITHALANQLHDRFQVNIDDEHLICVSPNGVDLDRYVDLPAPGPARSLLSLPEKFTLGYTGHLYPGRGMDLLVRLARQFSAWSFIWVGGRPADVDIWQTRLRSEGVENVILTGFVANSQLPLYQAACDVLLMPYEKVITGSSGGDSTSYASPMKMFEYMASRRPILSSDLPVIREVLNPSNAVLCPPEDAVAWIDALGRLAADESRRQTLADQARQDVQQYTWLERARRALSDFPGG